MTKPCLGSPWSLLEAPHFRLPPGTPQLFLPELTIKIQKYVCRAACPNELTWCSGTRDKNYVLNDCP